MSRTYPISTLTCFFLILTFFSKAQKISIDATHRMSSGNRNLNGVNLIAADEAGGVHAEMIRDRGFEWDPLVNNRWFVSSTGAETLKRDSAEAVGGRFSGKLTVAGYGGQEIFLYTDAINIVAGRQYDFSVWLRSEGYNDSLSFHIGWSASSAVTQTFTLPSISAAWTRYRFVFTATSTERNVRLYTRLYGNGTVHADSYSLMPRGLRLGVRPEIEAAFVEAGISLARFPNGFECGTYQWKNAIGDRDRRTNQISADALDPAMADKARLPFYNDFGIDEFLRLCESLQIEPLLLIGISDTGGADVQNALELLEYCIGDSTTTWGRRRLENGHAAPYVVYRLEVGNEQFNQVLPAPGSYPDDGTPPYWTRANTLHYIDRLKSISEAVRARFPYVTIGAVGANDYLVQHSYLSTAVDPQWDSLVLALAAPQIDFLCPHDYAPGPAAGNPYPTLMAAAEVFSKTHKHTKDQIAKSANPHIQLLVSEFGVNTDYTADPLAGLRLKSALYESQLKIAFARLDMEGACYFNFKDDGYFGLIEQKYYGTGQLSGTVVKSAAYLAHSLFSRLSTFTNLLETRVESPAFRSEALGWMPAMEGVPYLSALASQRSGDSLFLLVVNSDSLHAHRAAIETRGVSFPDPFWLATTMQGRGPEALNTDADPQAVSLTYSTVRTDTPQSFSYEFPPHSVTLLATRLKPCIRPGCGPLQGLYFDPNPAGAEVRIDPLLRGDRPTARISTLQIFDALGRKVHEAHPEYFPYIWKTGSLAAGVYFVQLRTQLESASGRLILVR